MLDPPIGMQGAFTIHDLTLWPFSRFMTHDLPPLLHRLVVDDLAIVVSGRTCCAYDGGRHDASVNDREESKMTSKPARFRIVTLTMEGWTEEPQTDEMRVWRTSRGDVLSLTTIDCIARTAITQRRPSALQGVVPRPRRE